MYAKLIDGSLEYAKHYINHKGKTIINPPEEILREHGYKELIVEDGPGLNPTQIIEPYYEETETEVIKKWRTIALEE